MRIHINYDSCWQNSILDNKTISPNSNTRKFNKSKQGGNTQRISDSTILGVLYRLIGDQRTLHQIKKSDNQYFSNIEDSIDCTFRKTFDYDELVMLVNKSNDRTSDGKYIGVPKDDIELFFSEHAPKLWTVLYLNVNEVMDFINSPRLITVEGSSLPRDILNRISDIQDLDPLETMDKLVSKENIAQAKQKERLSKLQNSNNAKQKTIDKLNESIEKMDANIVAFENDKDIKRLTQTINNTLLSLKKHFPEIPRKDYLYEQKIEKFPQLVKGENIPLIRLYAAALYLQAELMEKSGDDVSKVYVLQTKGINKGCKTIQGFSKKGFNSVRDFLNPLSTGGNKKTVKTPFLLTKASGTLEINIDIDRSKAKEVKNMIECAGVSSFYLGKKGLAYVTNISTREAR